jgi:diketogulonate reductase-like aldo/keto reductase
LNVLIPTYLLPPIAGVCNFSPEELRELLEFARVPPHLVQSWMDPLQQARPLRAVCDEAGVIFQAYSSLGTQHRTPINPVLRHPTIARIASAVGRSTAQVALRWALQRGAAVIPRSTRREHIEANLALWDFELSSDQMAETDGLDGTDPRSAVPEAPPKLCADEHRECEGWAAVGECEKNAGFMHTACAGSCGTCGAAARHVEL